MDDSRKTKVQLTAELNELRQRVAALEAELKAIAPRQPGDDRGADLVSHWRLVVDTMPLGGIIIDPDSRIVYWNAAAEEIFGYPAVEALGQLHFEITIPPGDQEIVAERLARSAQDNVTTFGENENITKAGNTIICEWHNTPLRDAAGRYLGVLCMAQDITARKRAEEALRTSQADLLEAQRVARLGSWEWDAARNVVTWSKELYRLMMLDENQPALTYAEQIKLYTPESTVRLQAAVQMAQEMRTPYELDLEMVCADGSHRWLTARGEPIYHGQQLAGFRGTVLDITARKQAEQALRDSETRFRIIFEQAAIGVAQVRSRTGEFVRINQKYCDILGYNVAEAEYMTFQQVTHPDDLAADLDNMRRLLAGEINTFSMEKRYYQKDGAIVWVNLTVSPMWQPGETPEYHIAIVEDITARKQIEEALRTSEARYRLITENTADVIWVVDMETQRCTYISPSVKKLRGYTPEEVMALPLTAAMTPQSARQVEVFLALDFARFRENPADFQPTIREVDQPCKDGSIVHTEVTATYLVNEAGKLEILGVSRDITERKRSEEQLLRTQKLESLGILAGGVAHDFNNLLVALLGQVSLAAAKLPPEHPAQRHLDRATMAARRAADLTRQMLAYSGHGAFQMTVVNLNELIRENTGFLESSIAKSIVLCSDLADDLPLINADGGQMQQIIMNLVLNAAEAIEDHAGRVCLSTGIVDISANDERWPHYTGQAVPPGTYVQLCVQDSGKGMTAETLGRIFDPFFTTKFTGRGLGLAAVLGIVRGHQGGLWVESEVGHGTTFTVIFPVTDAQSIVAESLNSAAPVSRSVLIIDDEEPVRMAIADMLELDNLIGLCAATGAEGVALYRERQAEIGLVLLDLSMPEINGREVLHALKQIDPTVRVVLTSGYTKAEATRSFANGELAGFLQKPYDMTLLLNTVRQHLAGSADIE